MNLLQKLLQWLGFAAPASSSRRKRRTSYRSMPAAPSRSPQSASSLSSAELWSLAAGGVLTQNSGDPFDRLDMRYSGKTSRICLVDWWGVTDRPSLIGRMEWLLSEGHRAGLETRLPEVAELLLSVKHGEQIHLSQQDEFIVNHLHLLKRFRFTAWDHCRLINVARWGHSAGFITEAEAWAWIKKAALVLRLEYSSWKDIGDDFLLGYRYWSLNAVPIPSVPEAYEWLVHHAGSPWKNIPWDIDPKEFVFPAKAGG
jgi:hypothetical protein